MCIMASTLSPLTFLHSFFLPLMFILLMPSGTSMQRLCHDEEKYALLQFKQSFSIRRNASNDPMAHPKVASWNLSGENSRDCCLWDGVDCDQETGHVIGLDLSSSYLYGSINSGSTLFNLVHLQKLNLADNHFNFSQIPSRFRILSSLVYLNLSSSVLHGQIPPKIAELSNLISLDLSGNTVPYMGNMLELKSSDMVTLVQKLTKLEELDLSFVNISSALPDTWANLSFLTYLSLEGCYFWGQVPTSLGELTKLGYLNLGLNNFSGQIPTWLGNLTELHELYLFNNHFTVRDWSWLGRLNSITSLSLHGNNLAGQVPSDLRNLSLLTHLDLGYNQLTGQTPLWLSNLGHLTFLDLGVNNLQGPVPQAIFKLVNLVRLDLGSNNLNGTISFQNILTFKNLTFLHLSGNTLSLVINVSTNAAIPKFTHLGLSDCNINEFPDFLKHQDQLRFLSLNRNKISGRIPQWLGDASTGTLASLFLARNYLTDFEEPSMLSRFTKLMYIELNSNQLQGTLPIPPASVVSYNVSINYLAGEIPPSFCDLHSLSNIDLSYNNLSGKIPDCLANSRNTLVKMNLANNFLNGRIPDMFAIGSKVNMLDISDNFLEGPLPRSIANCRLLRCLDLSHNRIIDTFPFWMGSLPELKIINLRSNKFFGKLQSPAYENWFPKLTIMDLAHNNFTGTLPFEFFQSLNSMKAFNLSNVIYMQANQFAEGKEVDVPSNYTCRIFLANRGMYRKYSKIPSAIAAIDMSSNRFHGEIPNSIGELKMTVWLNLSNNNLSGTIPPIMGSLIRLESLDLSYNNLSGEIPTELTELTFLSYLNISHNQLEGPIPQGQQFATFDNGSYIGNPGLCGPPLSKMSCGNYEDSSPGPPFPTSIAEQDNGHFRLLSGVGWVIVLIGYGSGLVVGIIAGNRFEASKHQWFMKNFARRERQSMRETRKIRSGSWEYN